MTWVSEFAIRTGLALELRLELLKRVANVREQAVKVFHDFDAALRGYVHGDCELHLHGIFPRGTDHDPILTEEDRGCLVVRASDADPALRGADARNDAAMFVYVRQGGEALRPVASEGWLQPLDRCYMNVADPEQVYPSVVAPVSGWPTMPSPKSLWRAFDRELRSSLLDALGMVPSEFVHEVVQGAPHVLDRISDKDAGLGRQRNFGVPTPETLEWLRLESDGIHDRSELVIQKAVDQIVQLDQVFLCPINPRKRAIEGVIHDLHSLNERPAGGTDGWSR